MKAWELGSYTLVAGIVGINLKYPWANIIGKVLISLVIIGIIIALTRYAIKWWKGEIDMGEPK